MTLSADAKKARAERRLADQERERACVALKVQGFTFAEIANRLGYATHTSVMRAYERYLARTADLEQVEQQRSLELRRLERLHAAWFPLAVGENAAAEPQEARQAARPDFEALSAVLRIHDRRVRLLGLHREPTVDPEEFLRQLAEAEGLDPDDVMRAAEGIIAVHQKTWNKGKK